MINWGFIKFLVRGCIIEVWFGLMVLTAILMFVVGKPYQRFFAGALLFELVASVVALCIYFIKRYVEERYEQYLRETKND